MNPSARLCVVLFCAFWAVPLAYAADPRVQVDPVNPAGPCHIATSTQESVVRNYLQAWRSMAEAFAENNPARVDADFVGVAQQKLAATVRQQRALGMSAQYADRAHHLSINFCSPEGLSVEVTDNVDYDLGIKDHDRARPLQHMRARYVAVLTPTETRWKVRLFQAEAQQ